MIKVNIKNFHEATLERGKTYFFRYGAHGQLSLKKICPSLVKRFNNLIFKFFSFFKLGCKGTQNVKDSQHSVIN